MYVAGKPHNSKRFSWIISAVRLNVYPAQADSIRYNYIYTIREDKFQEKPHRRMTAAAESAPRLSDPAFKIVFETFP